MAVFGKDTIGGSTESISATTKRFCKFTAPADIGDVDSLAAYCDRSGSGGGYAVDAAIYADASGSPGALVANSPIQLSSNISRNSPAWYETVYATKPTLAPGAVYWLGVLFTKAGITAFDTGAAGQEKSRADTLPFDDPFGTTSVTTHAHELSVYATYTPVLPDADAEVSWAELEVPTAALADAAAEVAWAEVEVPTVDAAAEVAWSALEAPTAGAAAEVAWAELEVPTASAAAQVAWAELELPTASARADIAWAEMQFSDPDAAAEVSWTEFEVPTASAAAAVSWAEFEVAFAQAAAEIGWTELQVAEAPATAEIAWAELQVPSVGGEGYFEDHRKRACDAAVINYYYS